MSRELIYFKSENDTPTFATDHLAPPLPLPKLEQTLERYYKSLKPFGTEEELKNSLKIINNFKNGIGKTLQQALEERAKTNKNWVEKWWEDYAYLTDRSPVTPYSTMAQPLLIESSNVEISPDYSLKALSRLMFHLFEFWDLIRNERLKPNKNPDGSVQYTSVLYRRVYSCVRAPGEQIDKLEPHFKTVSEGVAPSNVIILAKGRIFSIDVLNANGKILTAQEILPILQRIRAIVDGKGVNISVPVLTNDKRTKWAKNRQYLKELTPNNAKLFDIIEKSLMAVVLDENCPTNFSEISEKIVFGDIHSKWADKSSTMISFRNGTFGSCGEHSCYDGTICVSFSLFLLLSLLEVPEPDWDDVTPNNNKIDEIIFDLDSHIKAEITRVHNEALAAKNNIIISCTPFADYGKNYLKLKRLHPDAFIQMMIQLTFYKMHEGFVPTYETALMRNYYNGRTETVRSCTTDAVNWVKAFMDKNESDENKLKLLKNAINTHLKLMEDARGGNGIDRHLFGLWCVAFERGLNVPELFEDVMYKKSGGGGNFALSTSTLGYTINNGYVPPMCLDGYSVFYSMTNEVIWLIVTAYRDTTKTSAHKFAKVFNQTMLETRDMIERVVNSKL